LVSFANLTVIAQDEARLSHPGDSPMVSFALPICILASMKSLPCGHAWKAFLLLVGAGCATSRTEMDPTVLIETASGAELGVSTDYGVVFLGRTARSGEVSVTVWFGDGPSIESSLIESVGGGLYTLQTEILLPSTALEFDVPRPGSEVAIIGREGDETWTVTSRIISDPRVEGLLLRLPSDFKNRPDQVGAGVFVTDETSKHPRLLGLVSGQIELRDPDGQVQRFLTAVGPDSLWRLVTHRREFSHKRRWVYREDIL
jgi:hypothetical protein